MNANGHGAGRRAQLVGTGLIGGSVAAALRATGWHVTGRDAVEAHEQRALELAVIDAVGVDPAAEVTFVAVPPGQLVGEVQRSLSESDGIVTDTGSVKMSVCAEIDDPRFVGGHPMAGSEQDGVDGSDPSIFERAVWVLTPGESTDDGALHTLQAIVAAMGADVVTMTAARHDSLVAVVSHVPHLMAATMMALADDRSLDDSPLLRLAAGGFRDMTRIAAGHPGIWLDICTENQVAILDVLDELTRRIASVRGLVQESDRDGMRELLTQARRARANLPERAVRPQELLEVRVPIPDRKGEIAAITMLAADCDVNIMDIEVAHSPEGDRGVLVMLVARAEVGRFLAALAGREYHPTTRELA